MAEPPFTRIAIVGLGLMGGSTALAIRARWSGVTILGVDRADVIAEAQAAGAIDRGATDIASALRDDVELVLLAAPVLQNIACLSDIAAAVNADARANANAEADANDAAGAAAKARVARPILVSDLSSTKQAIITAARALPDRITFLGGHPMAGAARGGFAHARSDLFRGRPWILTPDASAPAVSLPASGPLPGAALSRMQGFVRELGAEPVVMDAAEHDRVMAYVSHLPQIVASGLMRTVGPRVGADGLAVSGPGLADSTRLASSPAGVWTEICQTNAAPIGAALDALIADLQHVRQQLGSPEQMTKWLESGARWRSELPNPARNGGNGGSEPNGHANDGRKRIG